VKLAETLIKKENVIMQEMMMKSRYGVLLIALVAITLMPGLASAQDFCFNTSLAGNVFTMHAVKDDVPMTRVEILEYTNPFIFLYGTDDCFALIDGWEDDGSYTYVQEDGSVDLVVPNLECLGNTEFWWIMGLEDGPNAAPNVTIEADLDDEGHTMQDLVDTGGTCEGSVGGGGGGGGFPTCVSLELDGDTVTMTWRDDANLISDGYEVRELWTPTLSLATITPGAAGSASFVWDPDAADDDFGQLVLDEIGCVDSACEDTESRIYFAVPYDIAEDRIDMGFDTLGEAIAAGGSCEGAVAPPEPGCVIAASSFYPIEGESFSMELDCTGVSAGSVEWFKDDVSISAKPPSCITISPTGAVAGETVTLTAYDDDGAFFDLSDVWIVESNFAYGPAGFLIVENPAYDSVLIGDVAIVAGAIEVVLTQAMLDHTAWDLFLVGADFAWEGGHGLAGYGSEFATVAEAVAGGGAACVTKSGAKSFEAPFGGFLEFDPLESADRGVYTVVVNDGDHTASYSLDTLPAGSTVPVAGLVGLGLLIGLGAIGGALRTRKH
jgi:hypothetical protein